jgi:hypothetical protein
MMALWPGITLLMALPPVIQGHCPSLLSCFLFPSAKNIFLLILNNLYSPVYKSNRDNSQVQIGIPENITYDNAALKVIPVKDMEQSYFEIQMSNGRRLSECCGEKNSGKSYDHNFCCNLPCF